MISEAELRLALKEVDNAILSSLPEPGSCTHQFSARFERKMRTVIRHGNHPVLYKTLHRAACLLLVLLILFGSVMAFNTEVRASVIGWIKEQYESFYHYFFPSESTAWEPTEYTLSWVPDGYTLVNSYSSPAMETTIYFHPSGNMIQFTYFYGTDTITDYVDREGYECHEVTLKNCIAEILITTSSDKTNGIFWEDSSSRVFFSISAPLEESELVKLAEGVELKNN